MLRNQKQPSSATDTQRIVPVEPPYDAETGRLLEAMMPPGVPPIRLFRTFAHNPSMTSAMHGWGSYELSRDLSLTMRQREIVIDRTCARCGCEYEWGVHVAFFADRVGLTADQIDSLTHGGSTDPCWVDVAEQALIDAVDALHDHANIDDDLWQRLAALFDDTQLLDLVLLCGWYHAISFAANACHVDLEDHAPRFDNYPGRRSPQDHHAAQQPSEVLMPIVPDTKDWTWVLDRPCPECGFDARAVVPNDVADLVRSNTQQWKTILDEPRELLRTRPRDDRWSALEYACHVRDVFRLYHQRLELMVAIDHPTFPNWDQDTTAVEERYNDQDPGRVVAELADAATRLADAFDNVEDTQWARTGIRSDGATFTIDTFARYMIHDPIHHAYDVRIGFAQISPAAD